jgi:hypothetical protein
MKPWIWLPIVIAEYILCAYMTNKQVSQKGWRPFFELYLVTALPMWPIISRFSKSVVFDGKLFDLTMLVTYTLSILYFTKHFEKLAASNYLGLVFVFVGIWLFKRGT